MKTFLDWCKAIVYLSAAAMCITVGIAALKVRAETIKLANNLDRQITFLSSSYNSKLQTLSDRADLTWKNIDYLILNAGLTANVARQASIKELATLDTLNNGINASVAGLNETMATTNTAVAKFSKDSSTTLATTNTAIDRLPAMIDASSITLHSINDVVSDPAIKTTLDNIASISDSTKIIAKNAADETTKLVHPNKKKLGFWGTLDATALYIHNHFLPPIL